jgi:hypothetical protein
MGVTISNPTFALKTLWPQRRVVNTVYKDHAFLAMIPKSEQFYGENMVIAVRYADTQGRSAGFGVAQAAAGAHAGVRFYLTRAADYQVVNLTTEAILATKNDRGALIRNLDTEMGSGMNNIGKSLATALFRGRSGNIGRIGAVAAGPPATVTLLNINDVTSFEVGMILVSSATPTGANRATPATATITKVNRDTGVLTFADGTFAGTNWAANDYISASGDNANASGSGNKVLGLADWIPTTAPTTGDSFLTVDRSVDATRLGGLRMDVSGLNPEEGLITVLSRLGREGGRPDHALTNHLDFRNIEFQLGSKVVYKQMAVGEIGFTGIEVISGTGRGTCTLLADQDAPAGLLYALQMDTWKLHSLEECPMVLDLDGNKLSRVYNADQWEARIVYFANTACDAPGFNGVATMPS